MLDTLFCGTANFRGAAIKALRFSPEGLAAGRNQFQRSLCMNGCTYERIEADLVTILNAMSQVLPYDRQRYSQLEKSFHLIGDDGSANKVYLERMRRERMGKQGFSRILNTFYKYGLNYGVSPVRLLGWSFFLLLLGILYFLFPNTLHSEKGTLPRARFPQVPIFES